MSVLFDLLFRVLARIQAIGASFVVRLTSPGTWQQLAPLVALLGAAVAWYLWNRAGRSALGRAARWWVGFLALFGLLTPPIYFQAVLPDGAAGLVAVEINASRLGRAQFPAEMVIVALVVMVASAGVSLWRWRQSRLSVAEHRALTVAWRGFRAGFLFWAVRVGGVSGAVFAVLAGSGLAGARQVPVLTATPGSLWVGTASGVNRVIVDREGETRLESLAWPTSPLPSNEVGSIAIGPEGEVWIATARGLVQAPTLDGDRWTVHTIEDGSLPDLYVFGVAVDRRGVAWVATANGGAAFDPRRGTYQYMGRNAPLLHQILDTVYVDGAGRTWFGGAGGVNVFLPKTAVSADGARAEVEWAETAVQGGGDGSWLVGLTRYNTDGVLPDTLVFTITGDRRGRIWIGTENGAAVFTPQPKAPALGAYDHANWQTFTGVNSELVHPKVHAIIEDGEGRIWFGTEGGVTILDERRDARDPLRWQSVTASGAGGLPHPWVQAMARTPDGRIWAGTRGGGLAVAEQADPTRWTVYQAHPVRRFLGVIWPPFWQENVLSNDVRALVWGPGAGS